ncbi:MAG: hypothetical protein HYR73_00735 [Candidatus Eisenbacteria bacterium]|nr:hypothetical protein [Candidatus Eisenbacteria bacterium]
MKKHANAVSAAVLAAAVVIVMAAGDANAFYKLPDWNGGNLVIGRGYQHTTYDRVTTATTAHRASVRLMGGIRMGLDDFLPGVLPAPVFEIGNDF